MTYHHNMAGLGSTDPCASAWQNAYDRTFNENTAAQNRRSVTSRFGPGPVAGLRIDADGFARAAANAALDDCRRAYSKRAVRRPRPSDIRMSGLGQSTSPDMTFSITDPDVAASQGLTVPSSTTSTPSSGTKAPAVSVFPALTSGKSGGASAPITSAVYSAAPAATDSGTPRWVPWAIGGTVALIGVGLIFAARS